MPEQPTSTILEVYPGIEVDQLDASDQCNLWRHKPARGLRDLRQRQVEPKDGSGYVMRDGRHSGAFGLICVPVPVFFWHVTVVQICRNESEILPFGVFQCVPEIFFFFCYNLWVCNFFVFFVTICACKYG